MLLSHNYQNHSYVNVAEKQEKPLDLKGSTMMPAKELQIYLRPRVTLTFDLWPLTSWLPKLTVSCPCPVKNLRQLASKSVHLFKKNRVHKLGNRRRKKWRTNKRTNGRTDRKHNSSASQLGPMEAYNI